MKVLVVLAHPDQNSFNHAIADTCLRRLSDNGHDVIFHDLYKEKFDPLLSMHEIPRDGQVDGTINRHCGELRTGGDNLLLFYKVGLTGSSDQVSPMNLQMDTWEKGFL